MLPIINPHNSSPAPTLPGVVVAALNRPLTWSFAHTTTSSTTLSSTAVSSDIAFAEVGPSSQVLDVGCGPGALTGELVRLVGAENVLACDPSEPFVAACAARHPGVDVGSVPPSRCRSATTRPTRRYCRAINK